MYQYTVSHNAVYRHSGKLDRNGARMAARRDDSDPALVWERPEPAGRPVLAPLSRERIVAAAIELADTDGLAAVSLRKVAAALDAGPMRLYGYLSTKEELLDLMVDAVYGEIVPAAPAGPDWRSALRTLALRTRQAARRHEWFVDLVGGRPNIGPNGLAYLETAMSTMDGAPGFDHIDTVMQAVGAVNAYVTGAIRNEITELRTERTSGLDEQQWQAASYAYMERMLATGRYPTIAKIIKDATHPDAAIGFEAGLDYVLNGIAARIGGTP
jgi:AcrR family transcriptional regulator